LPTERAVNRVKLLIVTTPLIVLGLALPVPTAMSPVPAAPPPTAASAHVALPALPQAHGALPQPMLPLTWDLPVTRNERVDFWIRWLSRHNHHRTALWLERSGRFGPMTREKLRARGRSGSGSSSPRRAGATVSGSRRTSTTATTR